MTSTRAGELLLSPEARRPSDDANVVGNSVILGHYGGNFGSETSRVNEAPTSLGSAERKRLALDLQDTVIQMVVGNLLRYQAILTLLDRGETAEATRLLRQSVRTQRAVLADLRRLMTRISPDAA